MVSILEYQGKKLFILEKEHFVMSGKNLCIGQGSILECSEENLLALEKGTFWNVWKKNLYIGKGSILESGKNLFVLEMGVILECQKNL